MRKQICIPSDTGYFLKVDRFASSPFNICFRWHTADIPLDRLIAPGVKIDIEERANNDPDTMLMVDDLMDWEEKYGDIPEKSIVIVHTGRGSMYSDKQQYFGRYLVPQ